MHLSAALYYRSLCRNSNTQTLSASIVKLLRVSESAGGYVGNISTNNLLKQVRHIKKCTHYDKLKLNNCLILNYVGF